MSNNVESSNPSATCAFCLKKIDLQKSVFTENEKCGHRFHSRCVSTVAEPDPCPECALKDSSTMAVREEEPAPFNADLPINQSSSNDAAGIEHSNNNKEGLDRAEINHLQNRAAEIQDAGKSKGTFLT